MVENRAETRKRSRGLAGSIVLLLVVYVVVLAAGLLPVRHLEESSHGLAAESGEIRRAPVETHRAPFVPPFWAVIPFLGLLSCIAVFPLLSATEHWWHHNQNRFLVAGFLGAVTLLYYGFLHPGGLVNHFTHRTGSAEGWNTVFTVFSNAIFAEYIPFIVLLFSLYLISGGISVRGDLPAHPGTNCAFLAIGTALASFIGTTGAAMVLIRPLLSTNEERQHKLHTVLFFIFMVCNCGGLLLPIGDPPLFLGYLRGVPFTWTLQLFPYWLGVNLGLLAIYYVWDRRAYQRERPRDIVRDEAILRPLKITGLFNFVLLLGVVLSVALVIPDQPFLGTDFIPPVFLREALMMALAALSLWLTSVEARISNRFNYVAIGEVAALFSGIFLCMQVPIEILHLKGASLGIDSPAEFFWATGVLSSFLDNAPTYVVFFETATAMAPSAGRVMVSLAEGRLISEGHLVPISLGAVFMGANTYIGNGPNFMVKSIVEQSGVKMPSFFGYMIYSLAVLMPIFIVITFLF